MEEKIEDENVQLASITPADGFKVYSAADVQSIMKRLDEEE